MTAAPATDANNASPASEQAMVVTFFMSDSFVELTVSSNARGLCSGVRPCNPCARDLLERVKMDADAHRGRTLVEESREAVVILDDSDVVLLASRRARQSIDGINEGGGSRTAFSRATSGSCR